MSSRRDLGLQHGRRIPGDLRLLDLQVRCDLQRGGRGRREMTEDDVAQRRADVDAEPGVTDQPSRRPGVGGDQAQR
jgi:hypothetical protein